jgi:hypothetical protein
MVGDGDLLPDWSFHRFVFQIWHANKHDRISSRYRLAFALDAEVRRTAQTALLKEQRVQSAHNDGPNIRHQTLSGA